jgi:hypothetical protein
LKGFTRVFDKIKMKNKVILAKFNKYISQMTSMKDKVDFMNWIININQTEEQEIKTFSFNFRNNEFFTFI